MRRNCKNMTMMIIMMRKTIKMTWLKRRSLKTAKNWKIRGKTSVNKVEELADNIMFMSQSLLMNSKKIKSFGIKMNEKLTDCQTIKDDLVKTAGQARTAFIAVLWGGQASIVNLKPKLLNGATIWQSLVTCGWLEIIVDKKN